MPLDEVEVRRYISLNGGVIGKGARQRTIVQEYDPHSPVAAALTTGVDRRNTFFEFVRGVLAHLEIGALARRNVNRKSGVSGTILEFLYELHSNAYEHGKSANGVQLLGFKSINIHIEASLSPELLLSTSCSVIWRRSLKGLQTVSLIWSKQACPTSGQAYWTVFSRHLREVRTRNNPAASY